MKDMEKRLSLGQLTQPYTDLWSSPLEVAGLKGFECLLSEELELLELLESLELLDLWG